METDSEEEFTSKINKHMWRRRLYRPYPESSNAFLTCLERKGTKLDGFKEYNVTSVDKYFDQAFVETSNKSYINGRHQWDDAVATLQDQAITISKRFERFTHEICYHFKLPVSGKLQLSQGNENDSKSNCNYNWFTLNGEYYDPAYLYEVQQLNHGSSSESRIKIKKMAPLITPLPDVIISKALCELTFSQVIGMKAAKKNKWSNSKLQRRNISINHRSAYQVTANSRNSVYRNSNGWERQVNQEVLTIDLMHEQLVTHVSTMGQHPLVRYFPSIDDEKQSHSFRDLKQRIMIIDDYRYPSYVTSYRLSYYSKEHKNWIAISVFMANDDCFSEKLNDLSTHSTSQASAKDGTIVEGILTRYLRFEPLNHHRFPVMRVGVYGVDTRARMSKSAEVSGDEETITYAYYPNKTSKKVTEKGKSYRDTWTSQCMESRRLELARGYLREMAEVVDDGEATDSYDYSDVGECETEEGEDEGEEDEELSRAIKLSILTHAAEVNLMHTDDDDHWPSLNPSLEIVPRLPQGCWRISHSRSGSFDDWEMLSQSSL